MTQLQSTSVMPSLRARSLIDGASGLRSAETNALIDPATSFATKRRVMFSCQVDTKRERMTRIVASAEPVDPMIADANAIRSQGIISRECLIRARVVVAPLKDQVSIDIKDFAAPLCVSA